MKKFAVLSCLLFILSCAPKQSEIKGEVFVATQGGQNVKLGAIPVNIYLMTPQEAGNTTFEDLLKKPSLQTTNTDSEGKFSFTVPKGEYVILSFSSRTLPFGKIELYRWKVPVNARNGNISVSLNNSNLEKED